MRQSPLLQVTRITLEGLEGRILPQSIGINPVILQWAQVLYIQEVDLAANFQGYNVAGKGSYIYCAGQGFYVTESFVTLRGQLSAYLASNLTAQHITYKASQS